MGFIPTASTLSENLLELLITGLHPRAESEFLRVGVSHLSFKMVILMYRKV